MSAHTHTRSESPWLIEATLYQTDSSRSVGKHRKEGGEGYARKMKERKKAGMEGKQETMRRRERSKCRKTQTAGEREKSLWHIVVWCVVVSLQYSGTSRLPSSDVKMELELDGSKLHKYTNPHLYKQA